MTQVDVLADTWTVSMTDIVRYAGASGDLNPLHHDTEFATSAGYDRVVVMGALSAGWGAQLAGGALWDGPRTTAVRYRRPVLLGDTLVAAAGTEADSKVVSIRRGDSEVTTVEQTMRAPSVPPDVAPLIDPYDFVVEEGATREFHRAIRSEDPWRDPVPVTFPVTVSRWRPREHSAVRDLGFDYRRMLHARSSFGYTDGPLRRGERLTVVEHAGERTTRRRANGTEMQVATVQWTFLSGTTLRAQMEYELVELPEGSQS